LREVRNGEEGKESRTYVVAPHRAGRGGEFGSVTEERVRSPACMSKQESAVVQCKRMRERRTLSSILDSAVHVRCLVYSGEALREQGAVSIMSERRKETSKTDLLNGPGSDSFGADEIGESARVARVREAPLVRPEVVVDELRRERTESALQERERRVKTNLGSLASEVHV
jgi:hypothetical protein